MAPLLVNWMVSVPPVAVNVAKVWPPDWSSVAVHREERPDRIEAEDVVATRARRAGEREGRARVVAIATVEDIERAVADRHVDVEDRGDPIDRGTRTDLGESRLARPSEETARLWK